MSYIPSLTHLQTAELYCKVKDGGVVQAYGTCSASHLLRGPELVS